MLRDIIFSICTIFESNLFFSLHEVQKYLNWKLRRMFIWVRVQLGLNIFLWQILSTTDLMVNSVLKCVVWSVKETASRSPRSTFHLLPINKVLVFIQTRGYPKSRMHLLSSLPARNGQIIWFWTMGCTWQLSMTISGLWCERERNHYYHHPPPPARPHHPPASHWVKW